MAAIFKPQYPVRQNQDRLYAAVKQPNSKLVLQYNGVCTGCEISKKECGKKTATGPRLFFSRGPVAT